MCERISDVEGAKAYHSRFKKMKIVFTLMSVSRRCVYSRPVVRLVMLPEALRQQPKYLAARHPPAAATTLQR